MHGISCDRCGKGLLIDEDVRYVMRLEITAAYDPMELTREDMERDFDAEYEAILREAAGKSDEDLDRSVHFEKRADLCPVCQQEILADPLFKAGTDAGEDQV